MPTFSELQAHYRTLPDERLLQLALEEADGLTAEAVAALKSEIHFRGLAERIDAAVEVQRRPHDPEEERLLVARFRRLPCPVCGDSAGLLNAVVLARVRTILFAVGYEEFIVIACPPCISRETAEAKTGGLSWLLFPWGTVKNIRVMNTNRIARSTALDEGPSEFLLAYVAENRGTILYLVQQHEKGATGG